MPASYLLLVYAFMVLVGGLFFAFNIYHIAKFGLDSFSTRIVLIGYTTIFGLSIVLGMDLLLRLDWSRDLTIVIPNLF